MNYDYSEYHNEKQQNKNNNLNLINNDNSRTVITKCSKTRSQHTIKQLLDMNRKHETEKNKSNQSTTSSPTKSITNTPTLALLINSERPFQRHIHEMVDQSNSEPFSPSTTSSLSSINVKMTTSKS